MVVRGLCVESLPSFVEVELLVEEAVARGGGIDSLECIRRWKSFVTINTSINVHTWETKC